MKPYSPKILAAFLALSAGIHQAHALDAEALFQQASPSIWVVNAMNAQDKLISAGSAVVIGPGRLVTNCHVLARASSFKLRQGKVTLPGKLEFPDVERDLCQVKVDGLKAPAVTIAPSRNLRVGQKVFTLGAPSALEETISDGLLSSLRLDPDGKLRFLQISAPISSGSSGGGLFNDKGELIGITTAMLAGTTLQNLSFAVPADWIWELEARGRAALEKRSAAKQATLTVAAANAVPAPASAIPVTPATPVAPVIAPAAPTAPVSVPESVPVVVVTKAPTEAPTVPTPTAPAAVAPPTVVPPAVTPPAVVPPVVVPPTVTAPPTVTPPIVVTPPTVRTTAAPPAEAPPVTQAATTGWSGLMRCEARQGSEKSDAAYQSDFDVQIANSTVTLRRKNAEVAEALTGRISDGHLELKGVGYSVEHPENIWKFRFNGDFQSGSLAYSGKGNMLLGADAIRICDVTIKRI